MKKNLFLVMMTGIALVANAQKKSNNERISNAEDRIAIKNIVDTFSILADQKETQKQTLLFTEDATVESRMQGQPASKLIGRKQIGDAFTAFLNNFETVYHLNGQQTVAINGNTATATSYCLVVLIGSQNGKQIKTTMGVYYNDEFVKKDNHWLIKQRISNFAWRENQELAK